MARAGTGRSNSQRTNSYIGKGIVPPVGGAPILQTLTVAPTTATVGTAFAGSVSGKTAGSTLTLTGAGAAGLSINVVAITGTPTTAGAVNVVETLAGAVGSPKTNASRITAAVAAPVLATLALTTAAFTAGAAAGTVIGSITGKTAGSTITVSDNRLAVSSDGSQLLVGVSASSAGTINATLTETLAGATGSPKDTAVTVTVSASGSMPAFAYQAETTTLRNSFGTASADRRTKTYNTAIKRLKDEGLFEALLALWTAGANEIDSRRNIITPGTYDLVPVGSPVFTANDGWVAATPTTDALDTQIPLGALTPTSSTFGFTSANAAAASDNSDMGVVDGSGGAIIRAKSASASAARCRMFSADFDASSSVLAELTGFHALTRRDSASFSFNHNGINATNDTTAALIATTTATKTLHLLKANGAGNGGGRKFRTAFVAKRALTEMELRKLHAIILQMETHIAYGEPTTFDAGYAPASASADVVIYGTTSMAIAAAYSAKRAGKSVIIVGGWRDTNLGGMSGNGLGFTDFDNVNALWGISAYMIARLKVLRAFVNGTSTIFEPRHFQWVCNEMLDPSRPNGLDIPIYWSTGIVSATKKGAKLTTITTADGRTFTGAEFIDCSYETDLAPFAGVSFLIGREAAGTGQEAFNGFRGIDLSTAAGSLRDPSNNSPVSIDPYITPGDPSSGLIKLVSRRPATATGAADSLTQAYNFRLTWTNNVGRRIPFDTTPPPGYDKANYEVLLRQFALLPNMTFAQVFKPDGLIPANTRDVNNQTFGFSTDSIVGAAEYIAATTYAAREVAWKNIENYILGLIYLLGYEADSRIPSAVRTTLATFGWDALHYVGAGKPGDRLFFPRALYVRELRRLRSDIIWNGNDIAATDGTVPRSTKTVSQASYAMDSHNTGRWEDTSVSPARVVNEGGLFSTSAGGADKISPLPIDIFIPKKAECENCSFIFGASATHVAFGSIRMELTAMESAQSMALAAVQAITAGQALQDLDYPTLRTAILNSATLTGETAPNLPQVN